MAHSEYETSNPYLATFLLCCGATLVCFTRASRRRFLFRFVADARLHQLLRLWWSNTAVPLVPSRVFASLQRLRSLVRGSPLHVTREVAPSTSPSPVSPAGDADIEQEQPVSGTASVPPLSGSILAGHDSPGSR
jgi:hypothetical protein